MKATTLEHTSNEFSQLAAPVNAPAVGFFNGGIECAGGIDLKEWIARHGEVPLKSCYGGRGATAWRSIVASERYELGLRERACLELFLSTKSPQLSSVGTIVHMGSGDGAEIPIILRHEDFHKDLTYVLVDVSPDLIDLAAETYCSLRPKRALLKITTDLETEQGHDFISAIVSERPRLFLLVANGALLSDPLTWQTLTASMRDIDYALILLEVADFSSPDVLAHSYRIGPVQALLRNGLRQVGFEEADALQGYSVQVDTGELIVAWTPTREARRKWEFEAGLELSRESLVLLRSVKPTYSGFQETLVQWGFELCESLNHPGTQCAGFLLRRLF